MGLHGFENVIPIVKATIFTGDTAVEKAHTVNRDDVPASAVINPEDETRFETAGAITPPYNAEVLCGLFEVSNSLRPNVDAYATNIDAFGHRFDPIIDLTKKDSDQKISDAIFMERLHEAGTDDLTKVKLPTAKEVKARKELIALEMRLEHSKLTNFFDFCCLDISFTQLRRMSRQDKEVIGYSFWEVLRVDDIPVQFTYLPAFTVRLTPLDKVFTEVEVNQRITPLTFASVKMLKKFRRYVQVFGSQTKYFKEYGDPRVVSSKTGSAFVDRQAFVDKEGDGDEAHTPPEATELMYFPIHNPQSSYGVPRWIGSFLSVIGSRQSEEVNFLYFDNKSVPPLAILVSGGSLSDDSVTRITDFLGNEIKGRRNFHSVLVLEAEAPGTKAAAENTGRVKIEMKPLTSAQHNDALFQKYDERNIDKVGMAFRLPRMLRGDIRDFNRSCYSEDTETLTETGWKRWFEIGDDERIAAFDPKTRRMEFVVPTGRHVYPVENEEMWRFQNSHIDCLVTHDHKMLLQSAQTRAIDPRWEEFKASEIPYDRFNVVCAPDSWSGHELDEFWLLKTDQCTIERGHRHAEAIRMDDWLEFLGYFVSEGGVVTTNHPAAPYLVYIDQKKPDIIARMRACFDRIGWKYSTQEKPCGTTHFLWSNRCLRDWLVRNVGTNSHNKCLPSDYLALSRRQLGILFGALMDGDGSRDPRENRTAMSYYSASSQLAGQVQRIALQLGIRATIGAGVGVLRVMMSEHRTTRLHATSQARTPAGVTREKYTGMVYCFSVPSHGFFVTRRNGKVAIQGNTADAALNFAEMQVFQPEREDFDFVINRKLLSVLGIKYWTFVSNAPVTRNPEVMSNIIRNLANAGVLWPEVGIQLAQDVFNKTFDAPDADWIKQPIQLTVAQVPVDSPLDAANFGAQAGIDDDDDDDDDVEIEVTEPPDDDAEDGDTEKADLSVGDLDAAGRKQPAQGQPVEAPGVFSNSKKKPKRPRLMRLKPKEAVKMILAIQKGLEDHQAKVADRDFKAAMDDVDDEDPSR